MKTVVKKNVLLIPPNLKKKIQNLMAELQDPKTF